MNPNLSNPTETPYPDEFVSLCQPGNKVRISYPAPNPNNRLYHLLAIIENQLVAKHWSQRYGWEYRVIDPYELFLKWEIGALVKG